MNSLLLIVLATSLCVVYVRGDDYCTGGPSVWTYPVADAAAPTAPLMSNDCPLPTDLDPNLYYVPPSKTQRRPWDPTGDTVVNGPGAGWALDQEYSFGCMQGGWCPYACKAGYIESQFDDLVGQPWAWQTSCNGQNVFVGAGRRTVDCSGGLNGSPCAGGNQGLYCGANDVATVSAPSSSSLGYTTPCIPSAPGVELVNLAPFEVSACRTIFPGSEIPQIPTTVEPGQTVPITVPPVYTASQQPAWWTAGRSNSAGLQHYFMTPNLGQSQPCLDPICQWITTRPATGLPSVGGIDYSPYILEVAPSSVPSFNGYNLAVRINCDSSLGDPIANAGNSYDTSLGNPGYGLRIYDVNGNLACDAFWTGPAMNEDCSTICRGDRCANQPCSGSDCAMAPPNCAAVQCSPVPVEPHINSGNGQPFATGTGLLQACSVTYDVDNDVGKSIRIELYSTVNFTGISTSVAASVGISSSIASSAASVSVGSGSVSIASSASSTSGSASSESSSSSGASSSTGSNSVCLGASACISSSGEVTCYQESAFTCDNGYLCPLGFQACLDACFDPSVYQCVDGGLQPAGNAVLPPPVAVTYPPTAPATNSPTSPIGDEACTGASACVSSSGQVTCYQPSLYSCDNGFLCPFGNNACGQSCYSPSEYQCANGSLESL